ncbi:hypothetical protein SCHPADRAFT_263502 [Schizopora paradoxa]|uniref:Uncharacterized protein n=1 Tax=Schizopora paradoxa TaxID=27342 RepID=A0A0H2RUF8_9AGAM|nr:hypothetical protein SCHPADRAFT_263502 [Schizopora paradoxa]
MASVDLRDESQLLWIEIGSVTISDDKVDEVEVSIHNSEGKEEMKSKAVDNQKGGGKGRKKSVLHAMDLKATCIAFSGDTIFVTPPHGSSTKLKRRCNFFSKWSRDRPPPQKKEREEIDAKSVIQFLIKKNFKDGQTFEYSLKDTSVTLHVTMRSLGALSGSSVDDSKLGEEYDKLKDKSLAATTLNAVKHLASNLEEMADPLKVVDAVMKTAESIAEAHPFLKTAVIALSIPYKVRCVTPVRTHLSETSSIRCGNNSTSSRRT